MEIMFIDSERTGYEPAQVGETLTVGELAEILAVIADRHGEDMRVYLRHDNGYTYGGITNEYLNLEDVEDEE